MEQKSDSTLHGGPINDGALSDNLTQIRLSLTDHLLAFASSKMETASCECIQKVHVKLFAKRSVN